VTRAVTGVESLRRRFRDVQTVRVATVGPDGAPHVAPLWFVWQEDAFYLTTSKGGTTWSNARHDPRVSLVLDVGRDWAELAGLIAKGRAEAFDVQDPAVKRAISAWHEKYRQMLAGEGFRRLTERIADLGLLRVAPEQVESWDHSG
jgi:nitroimidazol reductase NimA-like FMN-containing flavoprotein (pyridoxamine 5'-phosphate oxidase superfamily)